ncbi:phosphoribosylaminoimidazolesuccinocarboxamide synthase [Amycolatopsis sp. SID8362]|uniref:phosphoribosylaminoimidazolesuccinocarboxamide synthase n=1 Tax=Amycolatopsis sp. SID8362 TaxID=2690346 RepID=UPI00136B649A|nr:phosphoribosylaminoimidazolesuccinocarboxamide synthase [Amycolatopsis sp. SID8362]NBH11912.1 phosphoribosylaminoimidazolesuccinocarboxamide synthase [Amycolatopsis sp. SID8362]NED48603.1 phosphoribosylaminoimidazolesuccinocarboxamide synthase [Amycolatopsis sp. SID8362]
MTPLPTVAAGKVRDLYAVGADHLLVVASDRISAFERVFPTPVPDKGRVLTAMSAFWFRELADVLPNHLVASDGPLVPAAFRGRGLLVERLDMLPVEAVVRGYLTGRGYADYRRSGAVCGLGLPAGLPECARLPEPIFTPSTKARPGEPDENIDFDTFAAILGRALAEEVREASLELYRRGAARAAEQGLLLADTKFEFGIGATGGLVLADEVLTPDSARYWLAGDHRPGRPRPSFDKQHVRDWLVGPSSGWDCVSALPPLPPAVVTATRDRYLEAYRRITGLSLADWPRDPADLRQPASRLGQCGGAGDRRDAHREPDVHRPRRSAALQPR